MIDENSQNDTSGQSGIDRETETRNQENETGAQSQQHSAHPLCKNSAANTAIAIARDPPRSKLDGQRLRAGGGGRGALFRRRFR